MIVKKHKTRDGQLLLAVCDSELKGKKLSEKEIQLDLSSDFYNGEEMGEEEILKLFSVVYIVNLVGEKSVELAQKAKIIDKENVIMICGIPHAQGIVFRGD